MNYCERLREFRKILGINQTKMGEILGIPQTTYSNYENGSREIPIDVIDVLSRFGLSVAWLVSGEINSDRLRYLQDTQVLNEHKLPLLQVSIELGVPVEFIHAIFDGLVSPTDEFYKKMLSALRLPDIPDYVEGLKKSVKALKEKRAAAQTAKTTEEFYDMQAAFDRSQGERHDLCLKLEALEKELKEAKERFEEVKNNLHVALEEKGEWKGKAMYLEQLYRETTEKLEKIQKS